MANTTEYRVTGITTEPGALRVHKATCKRVPNGRPATAADLAEATRYVAASCCKPKLPAAAGSAPAAPAPEQPSREAIEDVKAALRPGLAAIDKTVEQGKADGLTTDLAIERALLRTSKALASAWATVHGTQVAKSWTKERIAAEAARTERNRARQHGSPERQAERAAKAEQPAESADTASVPTAELTDSTGAYADRAKRLAAAKAEAKQLAEYRRSGATNGRPVTPNLDALEREQQAAERTTSGAKASTPEAATSPAEPKARKLSGSERGQQARAIKREKGKRGPGKKVSADELAAYVAKVRKAHPGDSRSDAMEYAYWIDLLAFSRPAWNAAWEAAEPTA